jgi:hypothetical protein
MKAGRETQALILDALVDKSVDFFGRKESREILSLFDESPANAEGWITGEIGRLLDEMKDDFGISRVILEAPYTREMNQWADIILGMKDGSRILIEIKDAVFSEGNEIKTTKRGLPYYRPQLTKCFEKMTDKLAETDERWIIMMLHPVDKTVRGEKITIEKIEKYLKDLIDDKPWKKEQEKIIADLLFMSAWRYIKG